VCKTRSVCGVNEGRACDVLRHPRATHRNESVPDDQAALRSRIRGLAGTRVTWGYPRIWVKLRPEGYPRKSAPALRASKPPASL